jgi:hypothetical protein
MFLMCNQNHYKYFYVKTISNNHCFCCGAVGSGRAVIKSDLKVFIVKLLVVSPRFELGLEVS